MHAENTFLLQCTTFPFMVSVHAAGTFGDVARRGTDDQEEMHFVNEVSFQFRGGRTVWLSPQESCGPGGLVIFL